MPRAYAPVVGGVLRYRNSLLLVCIAPSGGGMEVASQRREQCRLVDRLMQELDASDVTSSPQPCSRSRMKLATVSSSSTSSTRPASRGGATGAWRGEGFSPPS